MPKLPWTPWHKVVALREDLKTGELSLQMFAADLYEVMMQRGKQPVYERPESFFGLTFPTHNLRSLVRDVALRLNAGFVPVRKPGKLPAETVSVEYALEYGTDSLQMHRDAIAPGQRVLIIDDVLATGGTAAAVAKLVEKLGGVVAGLGFLVELDFLHGRSKLAGYDVFSLLHYGK